MFRYFVEKSYVMRAERLPQILTNNKLIVLDYVGNYQTDWDLRVFAREFPMYLLSFQNRLLVFGSI
jgi:hypothetical protein